MTQVVEPKEEISAPVRQEPANPRGSVFSAFRHRNYRLYWAGMILSVTAQNMEFVALSWLVLSLTDSPLNIGLTALTNAVPVMALNLLGGAIADRVNRRRLLVIVQAIAAGLYLVLAALILTGAIQFWQVLIFAFAMGSARAFDGPTRMAMLPQLLPREDIPSAVALVNVVWNLPRMVGPAIAGALIAAFGVGPSFLISGTAAGGAFLLFGLLQLNAPTSRSSGNVLRNILDGLAYVRGSPIVSTLIAMTFFNSVFGMSYVLMQAVFARDVLKVGSQGFGFMETAGGLGALVGVFAAAHFARANRKGRQVIIGAVVFGCLLIAFAWSPWYLISLGLLFFCGLFNQLYMTTINTTLQMTVPDEVRGRVLGFYTLTWSLIPLGGTIAGAVTEIAGAPVAVSMGGLLVAVMATFVAIRVPRVRDLE